MLLNLPVIDIRYIKGERNIVADALSRPSSKLVPPSIASVAFPEVPGVDFKAMAAAQDPGSLLETSSLQLRRLPFAGTSMWCDTGGGRVRPLVPAQYRRKIFDALHGLSHGG